MSKREFINRSKNGCESSYTDALYINKFTNISMFSWSNSVRPRIQDQYAPWFPLFLRKRHMTEVCWFRIIACGSNYLYEGRNHPCRSTTLLFLMKYYRYKYYCKHLAKDSSEMVYFFIVDRAILWPPINRCRRYAIIWALMPGNLTTKRLAICAGIYKYKVWNWWSYLFWRRHWN